METPRHVGSGFYETDQHFHREIPVVEAILMTDEESESYTRSGNCKSQRQYEISTKEFSETASVPITGGLYLLHYLCQNSESFVNVAEALNAYPKAARIATDDGWLPLHLVCRNSPASYQLISLLLEAYPEGASVSVAGGWYPLHQLCRYSHCLDSIKIMYEAFPEAANAKTVIGSTPLHLLRNYFPLRPDQRKPLIDHDEEYDGAVLLALSVSILDKADLIADFKEPNLRASNGSYKSYAAENSRDGKYDPVASAVEHSACMDVTKYEDVCNMLNSI